MTKYTFFVTSKKNSRSKYKLSLGIIIFIASSAFYCHGADKYYRYVNEDGVIVMDSVIPPDYVKNGYEVVTVSGVVLEVVPPAPTTKELEQQAAERRRQQELAKWDEYLLRRYSTVADIEAAKSRKLADFDGSLGILKGNASNIRNRITNEQARAADLERAGRDIPDQLRKNIAMLQRELAEAEEKIGQRLIEKQELADKYDQDIERLKIITSTDQ